MREEVSTQYNMNIRLISVVLSTVSAYQHLNVPLHKSVKNKTEIMEFIKDAIECVLKTPDGVDESVMVLKFDIHKIPARVKGSSALF